MTQMERYLRKLATSRFNSGTWTSRNWNSRQLCRTCSKVRANSLNQLMFQQGLSSLQAIIWFILSIGSWCNSMWLWSMKILSHVSYRMRTAPSRKRSQTKNHTLTWCALKWRTFICSAFSWRYFPTIMCLSALEQTHSCLRCSWDSLPLQCISTAFSG